MRDRRSGTLIMVRTACCETVRQTGVRCSICPHRPENALSAREFERELRAASRPPAYPASHCAVPAHACSGD